MNDGFINEEVLREYINNHTYSTYNSNIKSFLSFTFGEQLNSSLPFVAEKKGGQMKPDLCIKHNGVNKYISIKKGSGNSVHQENASIFFSFVQDMAGLAVLNNLKMFHYGDDTTNDTGVVRYNAADCKVRYKSEISTVNFAFNIWDNLTQFLDRFLFVGNVGNLAVDVVYHGTIDSGLWASREEIKQYVKNNTFNSDTIHFGPLTYQVWGRNEKRTAVHPDRRYVMQVKWGSIARDFENIRRGDASNV